MLIVIYQWRIKEGAEEAFQAGWYKLTEAIYKKRGSLGSRLHKAEDGRWLGYAQWPDKATRERAAAQETAEPEASALMSQSIVSSEPPIYLEIVADYLQTEIYQELLADAL